MAKYNVYVTGSFYSRTIEADNDADCWKQARETYGRKAYHIEVVTAAAEKQNEILFNQMRQQGLSPTD